MPHCCLTSTPLLSLCLYGLITYLVERFPVCLAAPSLLLLAVQVDDVIAYLVERFPVVPGDVVLTGTPHGVSALRHGEAQEQERGIRWHAAVCHVSGVSSLLIRRDAVHGTRHWLARSVAGSWPR